MPFRDLHAALRAYFAEQDIAPEETFAGGYELGLSFPPDFVGEFFWSIYDDETESLIEPGLVTNLESSAFVALVDTIVFDEEGARLLSDVPAEVLVVDG